MTPYEIRARVVPGDALEPWEAGHACIEVGGPHGDEVDGTLADFIAGRRWVAGALARLAITWIGDVQAGRVSCGCAGLDVCRVEVFDVVALRGESPPLVAVTVPGHLVDRWSGRIERELAALAKADGWRPRPVDEARWRGEPVAHVRPPVRVPAAVPEAVRR